MRYAPLFVDQAHPLRSLRAFANDGDVARRLSPRARVAIVLEVGPKGGEFGGGHPARKGARAADERHLCDHTLHAAVDGGHYQDVAAGIARPPDSDPLRIHFRPRAGVGDDIPHVVDLLPGVDLLAGFPLALAETAVVIEQTGDPRLLEDHGVVLQPHAFHGREAVRHHNQRVALRAAVGDVQPAGQGGARGGNADIGSHGFSPIGDLSLVPQNWSEARIAGGIPPCRLPEGIYASLRAPSTRSAGRGRVRHAVRRQATIAEPRKPTMSQEGAGA